MKYAEVAGLHHRSLAQSLKAIQIFSFFCFAVLLYCVFHVNLNVLFASGILGLFTLCYAVPVLKGKSFRTINGLKIYIVALVWAGVTVILPLIASEENLHSDHWISFVQRAMIVLVLTLPFEIRDLKYDVKSLGTIPQKLGILNTKILGTAILVSTLILEIVKTEREFSYTGSLFFLGVLLVGALWASRKEQSTYFASFWVEGIPLVWLGVYCLLRQFLL